MTRSLTDGLVPNRPAADSPPALTCWHGGFHALPELGYVAAGSAIAKAVVLLRVWHSDCSLATQVEAGMLRMVIAAKVSRQYLAFPSVSDIEDCR
jgi:hypothetical protein